MAKIFSTRLDETAIDELGRLSKRLRLSKRQLLEEAIRLRGAQAGAEPRGDVWAQTCGAWRRDESPGRTIRTSRRAFQAAATRHHSHRPRG